MDEYRQRNPTVKESSRRLITQVKILRNAEKEVQVDESSTSLKGDSLGKSFKSASGLAFVEFSSAEAALFAVRYLNNMHLVNNKGLIVDFSLQDARKLHARKQKLEKHQRLAMERKLEEKKKRRDARRSDKQEQ